MSSDTTHSRLATAGFGRGHGPTFAERREAAERRLTSLTAAAGAVDAALARFEERMTALGAHDATGAARESVRALLGLACRVPGYEVTLATDAVRVRLRHTPAGPDVAVAAAVPPVPPDGPGQDG